MRTLYCPFTHTHTSADTHTLLHSIQILLSFTLHSQNTLLDNFETFQQTRMCTVLLVKPLATTVYATHDLRTDYDNNRSHCTGEKTAATSFTTSIRTHVLHYIVLVSLCEDRRMLLLICTFCFLSLKL